MDIKPDPRLPYVGLAPKKQNVQPFTDEQEARIREIIREELAAYSKQILHESRFGVNVGYPPKEHK